MGHLCCRQRVFRPVFTRGIPVAKGAFDWVNFVLRKPLQFSAAPHRNVLRCLIAVFFLLLVASVSSAAPHRTIPGRIVVKTRTTASETEVQATLNRHSARQHKVFKRSTVRVVQVTEANAATILEALKRDPTIEFAEPDYLAEATATANDPFVLDGSQWYLNKIQAPLAWTLTTGNAVVAVLDSGINADHPDLIGKTLPGFDFVSDDNDTSDDFGHGTAVAGVIAAAGNNNQGVAGIAFGGKILPVKVMDAFGFASYSDIAQGIRYAVDNGARVINISIAGDAPSKTLQDAIDYAWSSNVVVVAAAGNGASDVPLYPAACEHVVAVAATTANDSLAGFSTFGPNVALAAPGENILTTSRNLASPYANWSGTSLASPMVAAAAALVATANPSLDNSQIITLLKQTADDLGAVGADNVFGYGRLNVARAVAVASGLTLDALSPELPIVSRPSPTPPTVAFLKPLTNTSVAIGANLAIQVSAVAATNSTITNVTLLLDNAPLLSASTAPYLFNWKPLVAGNYSLSAVAIDDAGLAATSTVVSIRVYSNIVNGQFVAPLSVAIVGAGTLNPNLNGSKLVVGRSYTMTAKPGAGKLFAGWEGIAVTNPMNPKLTFKMQPGLSLVARFIPSPFVPVQGNYAGLIFDTNGVTPSSSGSFKLTVGALGSFSGKILLNGTTFSLSGMFDRQGAATGMIPRGTNSPLTLGFHLDLTNVTDEIQGEVSTGTWTAALSGDRNVFSKARPASQAGQRPFFLKLPDSGTNFVVKGLSKISALGTTQVTGKLKDGRTFSVASTVTKNGDSPLYVSLNKTEGMIGWMNFPSTSPTTEGSVYWSKVSTNGFNAELTATSVP